MSTSITVHEIQELDRYEQVIERGQKQFREVGDALIAIRDKRLYRRDFNSFEVYCQSRWGFTARRANQLISAAVVMEIEEEKVGTMVPSSELSSAVSERVPSERVARELAKVPEPDRDKVIAKASEDGPVTALKVAEAAKEIAEQPVKRMAPQVQVDKVGREIPCGALKMWSRNNIVDEFIRIVSNVRSQFRGFSEDLEKGDKYWVECNFKMLDVHLTNALEEIKRNKMHAVCPKCQAKLSDNCTVCRSRQFISKFLWDNTVSEKTKAIISTQFKKPSK